MMDGINKEFVKAIENSILEKGLLNKKTGKNKTVVILSDILCLGKEAIYRRLRGDVRFSLEEVETISLALGISIDSIMGVENEKKTVVSINIPSTTGTYKSYLKQLREYTFSFKNITSKHPDTEFNCAFNKLPHFLFMSFDTISKFSLFKWNYQMSQRSGLSFSETDIPTEIFDGHKLYVKELRKIKSTSIIISQDIFETFVFEVDYFYKLNLLNETDVEKIKDELMQLLNEMEDFSIKGTFDSGTKVLLYISNFHIDSSYAVLKYNKYYYSHINVHDLGAINTRNRILNKANEDWVNSLKRYSILITEVNEIQRHSFFQKQRKIINSLNKQTVL